MATELTKADGMRGGSGGDATAAATSTRLTHATTQGILPVIIPSFGSRLFILIAMVMVTVFEWLSGSTSSRTTGQLDTLLLLLLLLLLLASSLARP